MTTGKKPLGLELIKAKCFSDYEEQKNLLLFWEAADPITKSNALYILKCSAEESNGAQKLKLVR